MTIWLYLTLAILCAAGYIVAGRAARQLYDRSRQRRQMWP